MCTIIKTEYSNGYPAVAKNFDIIALTQLIAMFNLRNVQKKALVRDPEIPAEWTSKFGSATLTNISREFPLCGMNEKGVVIEQSNLWAGLYPLRDKRKCLNEFQWIQMALDTCENIDQVIELEEKYRIIKEIDDLHYFISEPNGDTAIIEYIMGEKNIYRGIDLPVPVQSNDIYSTGLDYIKINRYVGEGRPIPENSSLSIDRFIKAAEQIKEMNQYESSSLKDIINVMDKIVWDNTAFKVIYFPKELTIHVQLKGFRESVMIDLNDRDFDAVETICLDLFKASNGIRMAEFAYSESVNRRLAETFFYYDNPYRYEVNEKLEDAVENLIAYPERNCKKLRSD